MIKTLVLQNERDPSHPGVPQPLFKMNPDGTGQGAFYGANSWFPTTIAHARAIPGSRKVVAIPRLAAVVHHGGIGTTQLALRAGIPSVFVPFFSEQQFWSSVVADRGAGIKMPPPRRLTTNGLAGAIEFGSAVY